MFKNFRFSYLIGFMIVLYTVSIYAFEEPKYTVLKEFENIEIRKYSSFLVAETQVDTSFEDAGNIAHGLLFDYISGNNMKQEKMEMTVPVNQTNQSTEGEKIEMAVPVIQDLKLQSEGTYTISFVLPAKFTKENVPKPKDSGVTIREIPEKIMAVREYSGTWSEENYRENEKILLDTVKKYGLNQIGDPIYARYNPPWWPWFLRRNEVMIEINPANLDKIKLDKN